jgi:hypothetical protein
MDTPQFDFWGWAQKDRRTVMVFRCHTCKKDLCCDSPEGLPDEIAKHQIESPSCKDVHDFQKENAQDDRPVAGKTT